MQTLHSSFEDYISFIHEEGVSGDEEEIIVGEDPLQRQARIADK